MNHEELFVGAVAVLLGVGGLLAALANRDPYFRSGKMRWIEALCGRWGARLTYALLGILLIALGVAIALGFGPNKSAQGRTSLDTAPRSAAAC